MNGLAAERDEREASMDQAADRIAYLAISYGLLALVIYRSLVNGEASWDLMALVILGGLAGAIYRWRVGVLTRGWIRMAAVTALVALLAAVILALATR